MQEGMCAMEWHHSFLRKQTIANEKFAQLDMPNLVTEPAIFQTTLNWSTLTVMSGSFLPAQMYQYIQFCEYIKHCGCTSHESLVF